MRNWERTEPTLLAVTAHPDDETFRPGGTLALLARSGVSVHLLVFTHGEAGSVGDPPVCTPEDLFAVRERELRCACNALGVQPPSLLDYPDGRLAQSGQEKMVEEILSALRRLHPQVLLSFGPDGLSGHPDHIAVGNWALHAYHTEDEIAALYTLAVPRSVADQLGMRQVHPVADADITLGVDISPVWEAKLAAIHCHATQLSSTPVLRFPAERQRLFFGREYFVKAAGRRAQTDFLPGFLKDFLL